MRAIFILVMIFALTMALLSSCRLNKKVIKNHSTSNSNSQPIQVVGQNERGVLFRKFANGIDTSKVYLPGEYKVSSFDRLIKYNIDPRTEENKFAAGTFSGKIITLELRYSYKIIPEKVVLMEYYIGNNYSEIIVKALIQSSVEKHIGEFKNSEIDPSSQKLLEKKVLITAKAKILESYVDLFDLEILLILME